MNQENEPRTHHARPGDLHDLGAEPVSRSAAGVLAKAAPLTVYEVKRQAHQEQFQPRIKEVLAKINILRLPAGANNWTGKIFGRIQVVAYSHSRLRKKKRGEDKLHYWVIRCVCGEYEMRTHQALANICRSPGHGKDQSCEMCSHADYLLECTKYQFRYGAKPVNGRVILSVNALEDSCCELSFLVRMEGLFKKHIAFEYKMVGDPIVKVFCKDHDRKVLAIELKIRYQIADEEALRLLIVNGFREGTDTQLVLS